MEDAQIKNKEKLNFCEEGETPEFHINMTEISMQHSVDHHGNR